MIIKNRKILSIFIFLLGMIFNCSKKTVKEYDYSVFSKQINIFGVTILATQETGNSKVVHAANVLAQYLDNNEDGVPDNPKVIDALIEHRATLVMFRTYGSKKYKKFFGSSNWPDGQTTVKRAVQDLYDDETHPNGAKKGIFDASLEEVLHLITFGGFSNAYPNVFGTHKGSSISDAVDLARGGYFDTIPQKYPENAWYTYNDQTCEYGCQIHEYLYWAITSVLGAQNFPGRLDDIQHEWRLNTHQKVRQIDKAFYAIYTNEEFKLPKILPDGNYKRGIPEILPFDNFKE
tara:strand:- start:2894 stop:3763 length:870 start_codon:yes stop_codon:yes gene_type:complete